MGVIIIGVAGTGLINILRSNKNITVEANKRAEVNRGLEFISDEIRRAETIEVDPSSDFTAAKNESGWTFNPDSNAEAVLSLNIPKVDEPVLYYLSPPPSSGIWKGQVIYRFGPPLDSDGSYTNANNPAAWRAEPLMDGISAGIITASCDTGFTASPPSPKGFYACVESTGKTAQIFAVGVFDDNNSYTTDKNYEASTQVAARAKPETLDGKKLDTDFKKVCGFTSTGTFSCSGSSYKIDKIGSQFDCNSNGDSWENDYDIYNASDDPSTDTALSKGDDGTISVTGEVTFKVTTGNCSGSPDFADQGFQKTEPVYTKQSTIDVEYPDDPTKYILLKDGDKLSDIILNKTGKDLSSLENNEFNNQIDIKDFLKTGSNNELNRSFIDDDGYVTLQENEYIVLFEIGQVDINQPGFDVQDYALLVTRQ